MTYPSDGLEEIVSKILTPAAMVRVKDWEATYERDTSNDSFDSGYLFKEIPELEGLEWIDSILLEDGNWI